ncbi:MAG: hypothetical protein R3336_03940 [Phycisphaeraceae bacterium]|nr:hypothetical protein [Phycisphaeraceae bacterium]
MPTPEAPTTDPADERTRLAWARWQLTMPDAWEPLKMKGTVDKGHMIVGDATCAVFSVDWERATGKAVSDGDAWVVERLKKHGLLASHPSAPARSRFTACGWAHNLQTQEDKHTTYWYGYSAPANLLLGVKVNGVLPEDIRDVVIDQVLPTLDTFADDSASTWAMYGLSFEVPAGFELHQKHLFSGDVALEFRRGRKETLMLRQVYPGNLALKRRSFKRWIKTYPFKEHRRLPKRRMTFEPFEPDDRPELTGQCRRGRKRLPFPLGWVAARHSCAIAAHDTQRHRLLVAEHLSRHKPDESVVRDAIFQMNLAQPGGGRDDR